MSKVVKKRGPAEKLSELEFEIRILERNETSLPEAELVRLNNLREMNEMRKRQGWCGKKTVPVTLLAGFNPKVSEAEIATPDSESVKDDVQNNLVKPVKKKKVANGYNYYVEEIKQKQAKDNIKQVLDMGCVRSSWKKLSPRERIRYKEMAQEILNNSDDTPENTSKIAKEKKRERDKNYNQRKIDSLKQEKDEKDAFVVEFENILEERKNKLEKLNQLKTELNNKIALACSENEVVTKMVVDKDEEEQLLKFKIKEIFGHHKICKK